MLWGEKLNCCFYVLIFNLWNDAVRHPFLSVKLRLLFLTICYNIFTYYEEKMYVYNKKGIQQRKSQNAKYLTLAPMNVIIRIKNTLAVSYECIKKFHKMGTERIGTHCLENFIGLTRYVAKEQKIYDSYVREIAKSNLTKKIFK